MSAKKKIGPAREPWTPAEWTVAEVSAAQALERGDATPDQQQRFLAYVVNGLCATYDLSFRPGGAEGARASDFAEGKRSVGLQIVKLLRLNLMALRDAGQGAAPRD
jgi:hypothetical protein